MEEIPEDSNCVPRITPQQFKDRRALFEKESSVEKGNPELVRSSKPRRVFSHIKENAQGNVRLSSEFEDKEKDNTRKVSEKSRLSLIGTPKDIKSKYVDLAVFRQPVCLVQNDENSKLSIERRIMNEIATIDDPVNVIAIAGPYRSGKSYLLNRLANAQRGFPLGNTTDATTKGIWAWCLEHPERNGEVLLLLDSEGIGDIAKGDEENDNTILSLMTLLSGTLVYNLIGVVDEKLLNSLSCVADLTMDIALSNTVSQNDLKAMPDIGFFFPSFVLCLRDFSLKIAGDKTPDDYFETCLQVKEGNGEKVQNYNQIRSAILQNFKSRKCFIFERPAAGRDNLARLEDLTESELDQTFLAETQVFVEYMMNCKPKELMDGSVLNGRMFSSLAEQYIKSIQSGKRPCIDDALTKMSTDENSVAVKFAVEQFKQQIESIELPLPDDFQFRYKQAQRDALESFRKKAVLDDKQTFQEKAEREMDTIKRTVEEKNRAVIKDLCSKEFQSMYTIFIKPKIIKGTYIKSGGYKLYRDDFVRLREYVQQKLPRVDSNLIQISALDFEGKYRKQDEEILQKAFMSESQIKTEMEEKHAKLEQEKSELKQKIESKNKEMLEDFKKELAAQREQELQEIKERYEKMIQDWQEKEKDLGSKGKKHSSKSKSSKPKQSQTPQHQPTSTDLQVHKPPMNETVLKTLVSLIPVVGPIAAGVFERFKSK